MVRDTHAHKLASIEMLGELDSMSSLKRRERAAVGSAAVGQQDRLGGTGVHCTEENLTQDKAMASQTKALFSARCPG